MNVKTENLLAREINQAGIETKVYDRDAQFYEYSESAENKTIIEKENPSGKRIFLTGSLVVLGGIFLFTGLAAAFFYFSEKMFHSATVNQVSADNLQNNENDADSIGKTGKAENGFESEKPVKTKLPEDTSPSDNFVKKETLNPTETKTVKTIEPNDQNPVPNRNSKELPKTIDSSSKTTNSTFTKQSLRNNETQIVQSDSSRENWTNQRPSKNSQSQPTSRQNRRDSLTQNNSDRFQDLPGNRREIIIKKIKQSSFEQRSNIKERLQKQRRKN
jgi:hypothetical protein